MVGGAETGGGCTDLAHASHSSYASYPYDIVGVRGMRRVRRGFWGVLRVIRVLSRLRAVSVSVFSFGFFRVFLAICFVFEFRGGSVTV